MIKQDTSENQAKTVYLAIGSNLGNRKNYIEKAKFQLLLRNIRLIKSSSFFETLSWPNSKHPKFLNIVLKIKTKLLPLELLKECKKIEVNLGRKKAAKNSPRECDIDVIDYNKMVIEGKISLPHPRMISRNFVLLPLFEVNKNWTHPITKDHIKSLIISLPNRDITSIKQI